MGWRLGVWSAAAVCVAGGAWAAGMPVGPAPGLGPAFAQVAAGPGVWRVATPEGRGCVAGRALDVAGAEYLDAEGRPVAFEQVRRSRGASVQWIAAPDEAPRLRVQLKYPVDAARGLVLEVGGRALDLAGALERSGDSLVIRDAEVLAALAEGGGWLTGWSEDTGRRIADVLPSWGPSWEPEGLADCLAGLEAAAGPLPGTAPGLRVAAAPSAETRVGPAEAERCGATVTGVPLHRGRLVATTGFFAPTEAALVGFDRAGAPVQVHLPGVFEALRQSDGSWRARLSVSADANEPLRANAVKGCLGDAWVAVCAAPSRAGEWAWGDCGEAGLAGLVTPDAGGRAAGAGGPAAVGWPGGGGGAVGGTGSSATGGRATGGGATEGDGGATVASARFALPPLSISEARGEPDTPPLPEAAVPGPPAFGLLAAAAAWLALAARRRRQSAATSARSTMTEHCA